MRSTSSSTGDCPRSRRGTRALLVAACAVTATVLAPVAMPAGADTFIDPDDRCLPGEEAPTAPVSDYERIAAVHQPSVDCAFAQGISMGRANGTFGPTAMTTRGQMASFIVRALEAGGYDLPDPQSSGFTDTAGSGHEESIEVLATIGVTQGTTATTYSPAELVRRDQMASFLVRAAEYAFGDDMGAFMAIEGVPAFPDVPPSNTHYANVNSASEVLGLAEGRASGQYQPRAPTQRQQMATFLTRLVDLVLIVE